MNAMALMCWVALAASAPPADGWALVQDGDVKVYARKHEGGRVLEVKSEAVLEATPAELVQVFLDEDPRRPKTPYLAEDRLVKALDAHRHVRYQHLSLPLISDRDYFMEVDHESMLNPDGTGTFRSSWKPWGLDLPSRDGIVRVTANEGFWEITAADTPHRAHATYYLYSDPGGSLPAWIINMGNKRIMPDVMHDLQEKVVLRRARDKADREAAEKAGKVAKATP